MAKPPVADNFTKLCLFLVTVSRSDLHRAAQELHSMVATLQTLCYLHACKR